MKRTSAARRRPTIHITFARAARLHRLVRFLAESPRSRDAILTALGIGLRTFYRELELLNRCGVKVRLRDKSYILQSTAEQAEGRLPFPDPQLSFAEMAELARYPGEAAQRLAWMLESVINTPTTPPKKGRGQQGARPRRRERQ
jgi:predicted DNA-binding transcriptional regulator YafY